jgi:hypothetical protein|nr:MAG TPA: hypothetical protein [Caudoviricetes sp.]
MEKFRFFKAILFSRTIWAVVCMLCAALVGINATHMSFINFSMVQVKIISSVMVVICALLAIYFRIKADHMVIATPMDKNGIGLLVSPLVLALLLTSTTGCSYIKNAELSGLDKAKITVATINDMYIPARTAYETFYKTADTDVQEKLKKSMNGRVNTATKLMVTLTDLTIKWEESQAEPKEFSLQLDNAKQTIPPLIMDIGAVTGTAAE